MDATTAAAIYAAALSTAVAAAQTWRWLRAGKTNLRIELEPGKARRISGFTVDARRDSYTVLWINVINIGERAEQVAWLWVQQLDPEVGWMEDAGIGDEEMIPPRGRKTYVAAEEPVAQQEEADLAIRQLVNPYRVRVLSGRGEDFFSGVQMPERIKGSVAASEPASS